MHKFLFPNILLLILVFGKTTAQNINISIYHEKEIKSLIITPVEGKYKIIGDITNTIILKRNDIIYVSIENDSIKIRNLDKVLGYFSSIKIIGLNTVNNLRVKPILPDKQTRVYDDDIYISIKEKSLFLINNLDLELYISGVVEAESGIRSELEYYKSQAIICRTYALRNFNRFIDDGYNLCDNVNCQAYKGKALKSNKILKATELTKGLVIVDTTLNLINAVFHSNSGGQTIPSEHAWISPISYLKSIEDTFALTGRNYKWTKTISLANWREYLYQNGFSVDNNLYIKSSDFNFSQDNRKVYYRVNNDSIPLKQIRKDWKLKSTFFSVSTNNSNLTLYGKGYGHGVGLSQEGAMKMAKHGYNYKDIVNFYYKNIYIVSLTALDFFKE